MIKAYVRDRDFVFALLQASNLNDVSHERPIQLHHLRVQVSPPSAMHAAVAYGNLDLIKLLMREQQYLEDLRIHDQVNRAISFYRYMYVH